MIYLIEVKLPVYFSQVEPNQRQESGQAVLEYILMLVITVAIILSLTVQFFKPMQAFLKAYMGDYVACLLDTGELPSLGNGGEVGNGAEGCNPRFEAASLSRGRPPKGGGDKEESESRSGSKEQSRSRAVGRSGGYAGSQGGGGSAGNLFAPPRSKSAERSSVGDAKVVEISLGNTPEGGFTKRGHSNAYSQNVASRGTLEAISYSVTGGSSKEEEAKKASRVIASELPGKKDKKIPIKPTTKAAATTDLQIEEWSLGDYFRFILIAAIIIVLIALVGGQMARLSKGAES